MHDWVGKVIRCRAAVAWEPKVPLKIETIDVSPPKCGEVRIKILSTSVCHSDAIVLSGFQIVRYDLKFPVILGHEGCGVVESVGDGVRSVIPGDVVVPISLEQCYNCSGCKNPKSNICSAISQSKARGLMPDMTTRFSCLGKEIFHFIGCSTFSEYTVVPEIAVCKINPTVRVDIGGLFGCGFTTGYGSAVNLAQVSKGSICAVWGLGCVGLSVIIGCKRAGASRIIAVDVNPGKFDLATKLGATECINPNKHKNLVAHIEEITDSGCDFTFECVGTRETIIQALSACNIGSGECIVIGLLPSFQEISIDPFMLLTGRCLRGAILGGYKVRDAIPKLAEDYLSEQLPLEDLITHRLDISDINTAFKLLHEGSVRTAITFSESSDQSL